MENVPHPSRLAAWVRAIGVLAAPAEHQKEWLESLGPVASWNVDELALEFNDGYLLSAQWVEAGWVAQGSVSPVEALNAIQPLRLLRLPAGRTSRRPGA